MASLQTRLPVIMSVSVLVKSPFITTGPLYKPDLRDYLDSLMEGKPVWICLM